MAEEAVYHRGCHTRFMNSLSCSVGETSSGRPEMTHAMQAFEQMCYRLETTCEQNMYTLDELHNIMSDLCEDESELYSVKHVKRLLKDRYGDDIVFSEVNGRRNVVCFKDVCHVVLSDKWYRDKEYDSSTVTEKIVRDAARLIASEIRQMPYSTFEYPTVEEMSVDNDEVVPPLLHVIIQSLVRPKVKQSSLAQAVIQASRPQSCIMPMLLGLAVQLDHEFGSQFLLKHLSRLGFCASYDEVTRYKTSVMHASLCDQVCDDSMQTSDYSESECTSRFTQFCADNIDHNICTLDGNNTFHGMGIIAACVVDHVAQSLGVRKHIQRLTNRVKVADISHHMRVPIVDCFLKSGSGVSTITLRNIRSLQSPVVLPPVINLNMLWHMYGMKQLPDLDRPNWSGFMQTVCVGEHSPVSQLHMLPIIDLKPTDDNCIYSTLLFVINQARKFHESVPCVTFDQPLYIKAVDISTAAKLDVVCRLGGFHTLMNFIGSLGYIMSGSGLEDMLSLLYGPTTVLHILSGKAYARAVRGHFIIQDALVQCLLQSVIGVDCNASALDCYDLSLTIQDVSESVDVIQTLYRHVWNSKVDVRDCSSVDYKDLCKVVAAFEQVKCALSTQSRTSQLWLRYIEYVDIIKLFLIAERTSDWILHLNACQAMLNLFAAAGHNNYAKSCRIYVQQMLDLHNTHPLLHKQFMRGNHTIRRSDRLWAGLSCDLVIEQTLMKSAKGRGGLTRGRGMHDSVRHTWTSTMSECASIHLAMSSVTGLLSQNLEHSEIGQARIGRDLKDLQKVQEYLLDSNPFRFVDINNLISLQSGVIAVPSDNVTCDVAEEVGCKIHEKWNNMKYSDISARKHDKVKTLAQLSNTCVVGSDHISVDVTRLFHRLIIVAERSMELAKFFRFELTQYPTSLFNNGFMRKPDKPALYRRFAVDLMSEQLPAISTFVVDGGCLLHKIRWTKGTSYADIVTQYVTFVKSKFGNHALVVFDGYTTSPSTKDHEHKRRRNKVSNIAPCVNLKATKTVIFERESFMANMLNKRDFVNMLIQSFNTCGITTYQSVSDADVDIVSVAIRCASAGTGPVTVYCDDTDVLSMLLYHRSEDMAEIFFLSQGKKNKTSDKCIKIRLLQEKLGFEMCRQILTLHALGGCDTTSAIFGFGKGTVFSKLSNNVAVRHMVDILQDPVASTEQVEAAGMQLLVVLYGGKTYDTLDDLRYASYIRLVSASLGRLQPEKLPPSSRAGYFHILRVHLQAVEWATLSSNVLVPTDWGWKEENGQLVPISTDLPAAPSEILHVVRCGCKSGCSSSLCSCRKNGLLCMTACKCTGFECQNADNSISASDCYYDDDVDLVMDDDIDYVDEEVVE